MVSRRTNHTMNALAVQDEAFHSWYRFVLSYPAHLVRDYLDRFNADSSSVVLDPFCGTGTTLVECKKLGISSIGIEANPMAYFASQVKTDWDLEADSLIEYANAVADSARSKLLEQEIDDDWLQPPSRIEALIKQKSLKAFPDKTNKLLLDNSISPLPLHKALVLLEQIEHYPDQRFYSQARLALASAAVGSFSNLRFGPEVGVGTIKHDSPVIEPWLRTMGNMARDIANLEEEHSVSSIVHCADARRVGQLLEPAAIDIVITSPPYPNEKDYTRITRLETVLLGFADDRASLQALKRKLLRSNTRNVYKGDNDDLWVKQYPSIQRIADEIEDRRIAMGKTSGFEKLYGKVTRLYFGGIARHLAELRPALRPGAQLAYVVGDQASYLRVTVRTGQLIGEIAETLGYEVTDIDLFRTRFSTATKEQLREEVLLLKWHG